MKLTVRPVGANSRFDQPDGSTVLANPGFDQPTVRPSAQTRDSTKPTVRSSFAARDSIKPTVRPSVQTRDSTRPTGPTVVPNQRLDQGDGSTVGADPRFDQADGSTVIGSPSADNADGRRALSNPSACANETPSYVTAPKPGGWSGAGGGLRPLRLIARGLSPASLLCGPSAPCSSAPKGLQSPLLAPRLVLPIGRVGPARRRSARVNRNLVEQAEGSVLRTRDAI